MFVAVYEERVPLFRDNLTSYDVRRMAVPLTRPPVQIAERANVFPFDGWIAQEHSNLAFARKRRIDITDCSEHFFVDRQVPYISGLRRIAPRSCEHVRRDVLAADESVHYVLIPRASALDDDVVDHGGKARIAKQRKAESVSLLVAVAAFTERYDSMCPERIKEPGDSIEWDSWLTRHRHLHFDLGGGRQRDENQKERSHKPK